MESDPLVRLKRNGVTDKKDKECCFPFTVGVFSVR